MAHPFGISSVSRYLGVELASGGGVRIAFLLDFAELPAVAELSRLDRDDDGAVTPAERDAYLEAVVPPIVSAWTVELNGLPMTPRVVIRTLEAPPGQNGLNTLRILAELAVDRPPGIAPLADLTVHLHDSSYGDRPGWREIAADDSSEGTLAYSSVVRPQRPLPGTTVAADRILRVDDAVFRFHSRAAQNAPTPVTAERGIAHERELIQRFVQHRGIASLIALALTVFATAIALGALLGRALRGLRDLDVRVRIVMSVTAAVSIALARIDAAGPLVAHGLLVLALLIAARPSLRWALSRIAIALTWSAFIGGTRMLSRGVHGDSVLLTVRIAIAIGATLPLAATTSGIALADGMAGLRIPAAFVEITAATARGLVLLREEANRLARARMLRAPDAGIAQRLSLYGSMTGALFERGLRRASRAQLAMESRGFDGSSPGARARVLRLRDAAIATVFIALLIAAHRVP